MTFWGHLPCSIERSRIGLWIGGEGREIYGVSGMLGVGYDI